MLYGVFRFLLHYIFQSCSFKIAHVARMTIVLLILHLVSSNSYLGGIYNNNIVAGIDMRRVLWLVFALKAESSLTGKTPKGFATGINKIPVMGNLRWFRAICFHENTSIKSAAWQQRLARNPARSDPWYSAQAQMSTATAQMTVYSTKKREIIGSIDKLLRQVHGVVAPARMVDKPRETHLSTEEKHLAQGLMRVNHSGEICAQALYLGQSILARDPELRQFLRTAAEEENDHTAWCLNRLHSLQAGPSRLAPVWFCGAMLIGMLAALAGDRISLGFLSETERQVVEHLQRHIDRLPSGDHQSRAILQQMLKEEAGHKDAADTRGAAELPETIRTMMKLASKVMTTTAYYI